MSGVTSNVAKVSNNPTVEFIHFFFLFFFLYIVKIEHLHMNSLVLLKRNNSLYISAGFVIFWHWNKQKNNNKQKKKKFKVLTQTRQYIRSEIAFKTKYGAIILAGDKKKENMSSAPGMLFIWERQTAKEVEGAWRKLFYGNDSNLNETFVCVIVESQKDFQTQDSTTKQKWE